MGQKKLSGVAKGDSNPLDSAVSARDATALQMVRDAIRHKQVQLAYQPVMAAHDTKKPVFYEGLIRVPDATGRIIPARDFMPAVVTSETGRDLDCLALELGLGVLGRVPNIKLSINMSGRSIGYGRWMRSLSAGLLRYPSIAGRLILEITESSVTDLPELVRDFMEDLQMQGLLFALDDFAADQTSFLHLRDFYFDIVKLAGSFSKDIATNHDNQIIAGAIAHLCRGFDIHSVANHVESPRDCETLKALGFDCLQGFAFGAPSIHAPWDRNKGSPQAA